MIMGVQHQITSSATTGQRSHLFFLDNPFGNKGFKHIGDLLKSSKSLKELHLNCNIKMIF